MESSVSFPSFVEGLKTASTGPYAFASYALLVACWTYLVAKGQRLRVIKKLPESDRTAVLLREYPDYPRSGLSAEQYLRSKRLTMIMIGCIAFLGALTVVSVIAIVGSSQKRISDLTSETDWQMFLTLRGAKVALGNAENSIDYTCIEEKTGAVIKPAKLEVAPGDSILLTLYVNLVVDNIFHKYAGLVYPVAATTTWDHAVYTIYDGKDAEEWRRNYGPKMDRDFYRDLALKAPDTKGQQFIIIVTGAALSVEQVIHGSTEGVESANSIWNEPFAQLSGHECFGYLHRPFIHLGGRQERVNWPFFAIPVLVK
jgi:hypothetical protein